ncbi:RNA-directed DNA polymerase, eukaryota [Artemisia annua]|uniref:RNA-directed DNA polymerase, eukaryota n=1 Tax=Artemisia annua TaxID=35608 RepID=A0A2U1M875_ARTAN|nr:RNA-directed DNA polymerase, eukaryota [Artemisia annua]
MFNNWLELPDFNAIVTSSWSSGTYNGLSDIYADGALFFRKWSLSNAQDVVRILKCFQYISGICINIEKIRIGINSREVERVVSILNCKDDVLPFMYLRLPVGKDMSKVDNWCEPRGRVVDELAGLENVLNSLSLTTCDLDKWQWSLATNVEFTVQKLASLVVQNILGRFFIVEKLGGPCFHLGSSIVFLISYPSFQSSAGDTSGPEGSETLSHEPRVFNRPLRPLWMRSSLPDKTVPRHTIGPPPAPTDPRSLTQSHMAKLKKGEGLTRHPNSTQFDSERKLTTPSRRSAWPQAPGVSQDWERRGRRPPRDEQLHLGSETRWARRSVHDRIGPAKPEEISRRTTTSSGEKSLRNKLRATLGKP